MERQSKNGHFTYPNQGVLTFFVGRKRIPKSFHSTDTLAVTKQGAANLLSRKQHQLEN